MNKARNQRLLSARRRLPAGVNTQQAVAEAIADLVCEATDVRPPIDADYVSKLERGEITWPNVDYRTAFRRHFGVATDADLGFYCQRSTPVASPEAAVDQCHPDDRVVADELVALARLAAFGSLPLRTGDVLTGLRLEHAIPQRIGCDDVRYIEQTTGLFERWDFLFGGGLSRNAVIGQLEWARQTHHQTSSSAAVRRALQSAIARLGEVAGWMSFDAGDTRTARRCWLFALQMAAEADDWPARVNILMDMAREAVYVGRPHDGLDLIRLARAVDGQLTATVRAAVHVVTARAHAAAGRRDDCLRHIGSAQDAFGHRDTSHDPGWIWYYDAAQLAGDCGHALYDLAMTGRDVDSTMRLLAEAARLHGPEAARSQAFAIVKLAILQMRYADPVQAADTVAPVLASLPSIRSRRLTDDLKTLHRTTAQRDTPEAHGLRRALRNVLRTVA